MEVVVVGGVVTLIWRGDGAYLAVVGIYLMV